MKTVKILLVLSLVCFVNKVTMAQPAFHEERTAYECLYLECVGENACGQITTTMVIDRNTYLIKYEGILIGEDTGTEYSLREMAHDRVLDNEKNDGFVRGKSLIYVIRADGKPVEKIHYQNFFTRNAKGEMTHFKQDPYIIECF